MKTIALLLALQTMPAAPPPAPPLQSLFDGRSLQGWKEEFADAQVREGAIRIKSSRGWVRTQRPFADFVLTFQMRMSEGGKGGVFVRSWPSFDKKKSPADAFRLTREFPRTAGAETPWETWRVECTGRSVRLTIDGVLAYMGEMVRNPQGYVGLWANDGTAEFRAVEIREVPPASVDLPDVVSAKALGLTNPQLLREVKPAYTRAALERLIQGTVWVNAVVEVDGTVGEVVVIRSLDPDSGLDEAARTAARGWRFVPALMDGKPVRFLITVEMAFTLK